MTHTDHTQTHPHPCCFSAPRFTVRSPLPGHRPDQLPPAPSSTYPGPSPGRRSLPRASSDTLMLSSDSRSSPVGGDSGCFHLAGRETETMGLHNVTRPRLLRGCQDSTQACGAPQPSHWKVPLTPFHRRQTNGCRSTDGCMRSPSQGAVECPPIICSGPFWCPRLPYTGAAGGQG